MGRVERTVVLVCCYSIVVLTAARVDAQPTQDLARLSLEDLINIEITSASRKEEPISQTSAAAFVLTREDIRRSGATTLAELLRSVPGLQVARIDSNKWAVSARGFNGRFANKMLVLIDGRSIYTPLFSGVYWDVQDLLLDDVERIEIVRGPGATLWGANAVNGVINIITKEARYSQGVLVEAGLGSTDGGAGAFRFGGALPRGNYRVYAKYFDRDSQPDASGQDGRDDWNMLRSGFRADFQLDRDVVTIQGDLYSGDIGQITRRARLASPFATWEHTPIDVAGGNALSRWTRRFSRASNLAVQLYYDRTERRYAVFGESRQTVDLDFQHRFPLGRRHDVVWGAGYRSTRDRIDNSFEIVFTPSSRRDDLLSAFVQDEIELLPAHVSLTLGSKFEQNDYTGFEVQPSTRLLWAIDTRQSVWGSVSRAVRTPSRAEATDRLSFWTGPYQLGLSYVASLVGNPELASEELLAYEAGYRIQPGRSVSLDVAAFINRYHRLIGFKAGTPSLQRLGRIPYVWVPHHYVNAMDGQSRGVELTTAWTPVRAWRMRASYSWLDLDLRAEDPADQQGADEYARWNPTHQASIQSRLSLPWKLEVDASCYFVGALPGSEIPAYARGDVRLGWRRVDALELSAGVQNFFEDTHPEFGPNLNEQPTLARRNVFVKTIWRF